MSVFFTELRNLDYIIPGIYTMLGALIGALSAGLISIYIARKTTNSSIEASRLAASEPFIKTMQDLNADFFVLTSVVDMLISNKISPKHMAPNLKKLSESMEHITENLKIESAPSFCFEEIKTILLAIDTLEKYIKSNYEENDYQFGMLKNIKGWFDEGYSKIKIKLKL